MKNCKEIAAKWCVSERTVTNLCVQGRIDGAMKAGKSWQIPEEASKPNDLRFKNTNGNNKKRKPLPIGISDYKRAVSEYYYVDKTLLIKEFLDRKTLVTLFTRPRRFGKTLNMDMLRVYFEKTKEDTSVYFKDKAIWKMGKEYTKHQGKYPVIFLTFKDVKFDSWKTTLEKIKGLLQEEFGRHIELLDSEKLETYEKDYFKAILSGEAAEVDLASSLENLSRMLYKHYEIAPIIIVDEYDTPIQEGYSKDFYENIINFMRNFFSGAFKDNRYLSFGFLTGILRIAQESIFSGLNNLSVDSIMDQEYDQFFGFTEKEVDELLFYYNVSSSKQELKDWYDGYLFGNTEIYNPWSVINYVAKGCVPQAYWANTGKNEILAEVLHDATEDIIDKLYLLVQKEKVVVCINQNVVYRSLQNDPSNIYNLLFVAGYLKVEKKELQQDGSYICEATIPNKEIMIVYKKEILSYLMNIGAIQQSTANKIAENLYTNDFTQLQNTIMEYMKKSISYFDASSESFYHGLVLGLMAMLDSRYKILSNRESGEGRYDIALIPTDTNYPAFIMELKWKNNHDDKTLNDLAKKALKQIDDKHYENEILNECKVKIIKIGIAFSGKDVVLCSA